MKRFWTVLLMMMCISIAIVAQEMTQKSDTTQWVTVRLKNGHIVQGMMVDYRPLESVTVLGNSGQQETIEWQRVKEIKRGKRQQLSAFSTEFVAGKGPQHGFRAMVDAGYGFFIGDRQLHTDVRDHEHAEVNAVAGYQLLPCLFVGGGAGFHRFTNRKYNVYPVFADVRVDMLRNSITPFVDLRFGKIFGHYAATTATFGALFSPALGCRFGISQRVALNIQIAMSFYHVNSLHNTLHSLRPITLRAGLEF